QTAGQHVEFAGHRYLRDQAFAVVDEIGIALRPSGKLSIEPLEEARFGRVHEHSVKQVEEAVAGGSLDGPPRPQLFVTDQDLYRGQVDAAPHTIAGTARRPMARQRSLGLQVFEITQWVKKTVRMINTDSRHQ